MQHRLTNNNFGINSIKALPQAEPRIKVFNKEAHAKNCKYRTVEGFCTRSSRTCPATLFTLTFNN
jgi:hypothetical protein